MTGDTEFVARLTRRVIDRFRAKGMKLKELASLMGLSESYLSRAARGERSLTLAHLYRLETATGEPLLSILAAAERPDVSPDRHEEFDAMVEFFRMCGLASRKLAEEPDEAEAQLLAQPPAQAT